jgi:hypothetical protein
MKCSYLQRSPITYALGFSIQCFRRIQILKLLNQTRKKGILIPVAKLTICSIVKEVTLTMTGVSTKDLQLTKFKNKPRGAKDTEIVAP